MKTLQQSLVLLLIGIPLLVGSAFGQTTIWSEPFDDASQFAVQQGATGSDGTDNYFHVTDGANIDKSYTGVSGSFLAAQDTDDPDIGSGGAAPVQIEWTDIDIQGESNLYFNGNFAEVLDEEGDIDDSDYIWVEYRIDGGQYQKLLAFENDGTDFNSSFLEDTNLDGTGEGTNITSSDGQLLFFTKSIGETGSSLDLRLTAHVNSGDEDFAADEFAITANGPLPVELASFTVNSGDERAILSWTTASESNNSGFSVQQQAPGSDQWVSRGFVDGAGTASDVQSYRFETNTLAPGRHTFRLKQVDLDGTAHYSAAKTIQIRSGTSLTLSGPNPVPAGQSTRVTVQSATSQQLTLALFNVLGQRVRTIVSRKIPANGTVRAQISTESLANGIYFVQATGASLNESRRLTVVH